MTSSPWLSLIVFLPLAGALLCLLVKAESARWLAYTDVLVRLQFHFGVCIDRAGAGAP